MIQEYIAQKAQDEAARHESEQASQLEAHRRAWEKLPRCGRCGKRMGQSLQVVFPTVPESGTTRGVCMDCVRSEANARNIAKSAPPRVEPAKPKEPEPVRDRFELLDLDEPK